MADLTDEAPDAPLPRREDAFKDASSINTRKPKRRWQPKPLPLIYIFDPATGSFKQRRETLKERYALVLKEIYFAVYYRLTKGLSKPLYRETGFPKSSHNQYWFLHGGTMEAMYNLEVAMPTPFRNPIILYMDLVCNILYPDVLECLVDSGDPSMAPFLFELGEKLRNSWNSDGLANNEPSRFFIGRQLDWGVPEPIMKFCMGVVKALGADVMLHSSVVRARYDRGMLRSSQVKLLQIVIGSLVRELKEKVTLLVEITRSNTIRENSSSLQALLKDLLFIIYSNYELIAKLLGNQRFRSERLELLLLKYLEEEGMNIGVAKGVEDATKKSLWQDSS